MFDSAKIRKAWMIRKQSAKSIGCKVSEVVWSICLEMADTHYVTTEIEVIEEAKCEITLTRANGVTETVCSPNITRCNDVLFEKMREANRKAGNTLHSYNNINAVLVETEIAVPMSNGDILDEIDKISAKAHSGCIMTREMSRRMSVLRKAVA